MDYYDYIKDNHNLEMMLYDYGVLDQVKTLLKLGYTYIKHCNISDKGGYNFVLMNKATGHLMVAYCRPINSYIQLAHIKDFNLDAL